MSTPRKKKHQPPSLEDVLREALLADAYITTLVEGSRDRLKMSVWWDRSDLVHEFEVHGNKTIHINKFEQDK